VIAALSAGEASTVWSWPEVMIEGLIGRDAIAPLESLVSAVTTNCCSRPVDE
jgi:hypothetical protein